MGFLKRNRSKSVPVDPNAKPELVQKRRVSILYLSFKLVIYVSGN